MFLELEAVDALEDRSASRSLQAVLARCRDGQHTLVVDDPEAFFSSTFWREFVAPGDQAEVAELIRRAAAGGGYLGRSADPEPIAFAVLARVEAVQTTGRHRWRVPVTDATRFVEAPLLVLLEDMDDHAVLVGAARVYGVAGFVDAVSRGDRWIRFEHGGGADGIRRLIEASDEGSRIVAIHDADHGDPVAEKRAAAVTKACEERDWCVDHTWEQREIDNYLPACLLVAATGSRKAGYRRWERMSDDERDRVDMAVLFSGWEKDRLQKALASPGTSAPQSGKNWLKGRILAFADLGPDQRGAVDARGGAELSGLLRRLEQLL
jgi:hypothetical protein